MHKFNSNTLSKFWLKTIAKFIWFKSGREVWQQNLSWTNSDIFSLILFERKPKIKVGVRSDWLIMYCFTSRCERGNIYSMPNLLRHGASVFAFSFDRPPWYCRVIREARGTEDLYSNPDPYETTNANPIPRSLARWLSHQHGMIYNCLILRLNFWKDNKQSTFTESQSQVSNCDDKWACNEDSRCTDKISTCHNVLTG